MLSKDQLGALFSVTLNGISGERLVKNYLKQNPLSGPIYLIALGKAAVSMAKGFEQQTQVNILDSLIVTKNGFEQDATGNMITAGHPIPDANSLIAGERLIEFIAKTPKDAHLCFLISGGTSSLVERLAQKVDLPTWQRLNRWFLASGWPIDKINAVRKRFSVLKGGGLLQFVEQRKVTALYISDTLNHEPGLIGSGLLDGSGEQANEDLIQQLPEWAQLLCPEVMELTPSYQVTHNIIGTYSDALKHAYHACQMQGIKAVLVSQPLLGTLEHCADIVAKRLIEGPPGMTLWAGECTVQLPDVPKRGGRCQHLALTIAKQIQGKSGLMCLAAATDGDDGYSENAGAIVDGDTVMRGQDAGQDVELALSQADSAGYLQHSGDILRVGPTGTNMMDLVMTYKATV